MKYALIVMLAVYLVTFGCNPKPEEESPASHDKVEHVTPAKAPTAPKELTVAPHTLKPTTPEAGPSNNYGTASKTTPAAPANVELTTEKVKTEATPVVKEKNVTEVKETPQVEEKALPAPEKAEAKTDQWKSIAQSAATTVLALMHDEQASKPAQDIEQPTVIPAEDPEMSEAMQKMVNATNDMVAITRQLVMATQQMLVSSKGVAVEVIDSGKDALDTAKPAVQDAINEQEIIATVKEIVSATKEAFAATSEAISEVLEANEAQPVSVTPQQ